MKTCTVREYVIRDSYECKVSKWEEKVEELLARTVHLLNIVPSR